MILLNIKHHPHGLKVKPYGFSILLLAVISSFFLPNTITAQRLSVKQQLLIEKTMQPVLREESDKYQLLLGKGAFVQIGQDTLLNIHGLRYLLKIAGDTVIRLDKSIFHGSNYWRYLFEYNKQIFSLGGYGQFVTNNNLESFNFDTKEWYVVKTTEKKPAYIKGFVIRVNDQLYLFGNAQAGNSIEDNIADQYFYQFDLPTLTWKRFLNVQSELENFITEKIYYAKDYTVAIDSRNAIVVNHKTLEFIQLTQEELGIKRTTENIAIDNNTIFLSYDIRHRSSENLPGINLITFWNTHKSKAKKFILHPTDFQQYPNEILFSILLGIIGLVIAFFIFSNNRIKRKNKRP